MSCWMAACVNTKAFEFWSKGILLYWGPNHWVLWTIKRNFKGKFILWWEPMKCLYCTGVKCNLKELIVKLMIWRPWSSLKSELFPQQSLVCKLTSLYKTCLIGCLLCFCNLFICHHQDTKDGINSGWKTSWWTRNKGRRMFEPDGHLKNWSHRALMCKYVCCNYHLNIVFKILYKNNSWWLFCLVFFF